MLHLITRIIKLIYAYAKRITAIGYHHVEAHAPMIQKGYKDKSHYLAKSSSNMLDPSITINPNDNLPKLLIVDDIPDTKVIYEFMFKQILAKYKYDIYKHVEVSYALGNDCVSKAYAFICKNKIDLACLDLTMGYMVKDGPIIEEINGVDLYYIIKNKNNQDASMVFVTAHSFNSDNPVISSYINEFKLAVDDSIYKHYINKNDTNKLDLMYKFLLTKTSVEEADSKE